MTVDYAIRIVQATYPRLYFACHTRHQRTRSARHRISSRDADILAHLDQRVPVTPSQLATHLGRSRSTVSEALKRLAALGYVHRSAGQKPLAPAGGATVARSHVAVTLTREGSVALGDTSVLETDRLRGVLESVSARDLERIVAGLASLGAAVRTFAERRGSRRGGR